MSMRPFAKGLGILGIAAAAALAMTVLPGRHGSSVSAFASSGEPGDANIFVSLAKKLVPSVVNISTLTTVKSPYMQGSPNDMFRLFEELFRRYNNGNGGGGDDDDDGGALPPPNGGPAPKAISLGTGFIIDSSGLILTNNHVVVDADEIKINFTESADEKPTDGEVVGRDPELDVALIRVKSKRELVPVTFGDSDALEVGEYVMAIGNPFGQGHSVTHGIISAKGRPAPDFILANYLQTDAPINPGNSGGPLVNLKGEVIGINNAIDQRAHGIGFAIPINFVKKVLPQLKTKGSVSRGYIGVLVNEMAPELASQFHVGKDTHAPIVTHVYPGAPAEKAGIKPYDVILEFNGKPIHTSAELVAAVTAVPVGQSVPVKVSRNGKVMDLDLKVAQRPGNPDGDDSVQPKKKKPKKQPTRIETGMELQDLTADDARDLGITGKTQGVVVSNTSYGGPADKAGLMRGDLILEADRKPIKDVDSFYSIVKDKKSYLLRVRHLDPQGHENFSVVILDLKPGKDDSKE